jgi:hypothetical protein
MWVSNIELLLETTINNEILTFQKANQLFRENDINGKINNALRGYSLFFSARKIDNPLNINYIDETISLKEKYYDIVKELLENYKLKIEDYKIAFHKFKLLLNKQNENRSTMQYLTRTVLPRMIFDTKSFNYLLNFRRSKNTSFTPQLAPMGRFLTQNM